MISLLLVSLCGQSCVQRQVVSYAQPVAYQQTYQTAYQQPYATFVPVVVEDPQTYFSGLVGQELRTAKRQEVAQQVQATTDAKLDQLTRAVQELQRQLVQQTPSPVGAEPPLPQPRQSAPKAPIPGLPSYPLSEAVPPPPLVPNRTRDAAVAILTTSCAKCHSGESSSGGFAIFDKKGQLADLDRGQLESISQQVWEGRMPKALPLPTKDQIVIRAWISESKTESLASNTSRKPL